MSKDGGRTWYTFHGQFGYTEGASLSSRQGMVRDAATEGIEDDAAVTIAGRFCHPRHGRNASPTSQALLPWVRPKTNRIDFKPTTTTDANDKESTANEEERESLPSTLRLLLRLPSFFHRHEFKFRFRRMPMGLLFSPHELLELRQFPNIKIDTRDETDAETNCRNDPVAIGDEQSPGRTPSRRGIDLH